MSYRQATTRRSVAVAVVLISVVALGAGLGAPSAHGAAASRWYWTPAACKSELQKYGVQFGDGRTFHVAKAYCVGLHNHCWRSKGVRRYKVFTAVARSFDGLVRRFQLTVTGRDSWSGSTPHIIEHNMSASEFVASYGSAAWSVAASENAGGCFDVHP